MKVKKVFATLAVCALVGTLSAAEATKTNESSVYTVSSPLDASTPPASQFQFMVGRWRMTQLYPNPESAKTYYQIWSAASDGSLYGRSYDNAAGNGSPMFEEHIVIQNGKYMYTLSGFDVPSNFPALPIVQASSTSWFLINSGGHWPARASYDKMPDGSLFNAVFTRETGYELFRLNKM